MSQRGPRISIFSSVPRPSSDRLPVWSSEVLANPYRRKVLQICGTALALLAVLSVLYSSGAGSSLSGQYKSTSNSLPADEPSVEDTASQRPIDPTHGAKWGLHEENGWTEEDIPGLADLGVFAEEKYRFGPTEEYFERLEGFAVSLPRIANELSWSIWAHRPSEDRGPEPPKPSLGPPSMISYKTIHQTDKNGAERTWETDEWVRVNEKDGWKLNYLDDDGAASWVDSVFPGTDITWAWKFMSRGVLRADFLRYLLPMVEGGVYSDVDTRPIRPIEQWGQVDVEYLDLSPTDGENWRSTLSTAPAVIVSIDVNVHSKMDWALQWPRAVGICQWTLASAPYHPIFIDAARRVVNSTQVVADWESDRAAVITQLQREKPDGWAQRVSELKSHTRSQVMGVLEWTGPGLFTDAVLAFLNARYRMTWHRLRGLDHPLRVGDVLILPITGFSPGGESDFGAEGPESPQADVLHNFRGSWKSDGA